LRYGDLTIFKTADIAMLNSMGLRMRYLKSPCKTSYCLSVETAVLI